MRTKRTKITKYLPDFLELPQKKERSSFYDRVYEIVGQIPKGMVTTYGAIGETLGLKSTARLVGTAMKAIPAELDLPAHRVVNRTGALTAAPAFGGYERLRWLLEREGVSFVEERIDMTKHFWHPKEIR
jgi:methylated-DNA-protein-cysteine methyltransferase related protein